MPTLGSITWDGIRMELRLFAQQRGLPVEIGEALIVEFGARLYRSRMHKAFCEPLGLLDDLMPDGDEDDPDDESGGVIEMGGAR